MILRNCAAALPAGGVLLISDSVSATIFQAPESTTSRI